MVCRLGGLDSTTLDRAATFADLGLDSLFLTQLGSQIRKQLGVRVSLGEMLEETPTIESLAKRIEPEVAIDTVVEPPVVAPDPRSFAEPLDGGHLQAIKAAPIPRSGNGHLLAAEIEALIAGQLRIMDQQLDVLASYTRATEDPADEG
jgi:acyl carrier protein